MNTTTRYLAYTDAQKLRHLMHSRGSISSFKVQIDMSLNPAPNTTLTHSAKISPPNANKLLTSSVKKQRTLNFHMV